MTDTRTKTCLYCSNDFVGYGNQFCSKKCKGLAQRTRTPANVTFVGIGGQNFRKLVTRKCNQCGKPYTGFGKMFCSKICLGASKRKVFAKCKMCDSPLKKHCKYFCSHVCRGKSRIGIPSPLRGVKWDHVSPLKGKKMSDEARRKMSESRRGEKSYCWKGEDAGYGSKHDWIRRVKGKAVKCEECGRTDWVHWSNIDHKYRRLVSDWVALCPKCHKHRDMKNGLTRM